MSTISHPPTGAAHEPGWSAMFLVREVWASLAIFAMWIAVAVSAVWGPDFVSSNGSGTKHDHPLGDRRGDVRMHRHVGSREVRLRSSARRAVSHHGREGGVT